MRVKLIPGSNSAFTFFSTVYLGAELSEKQRKRKEKTEKVEKDGFLISKKLLNKESNRTCEACNVYSFDLKDDAYMTKFGTCHRCYVKYVEDREERWNSGWRPDN